MKVCFKYVCLAGYRVSICAAVTVTRYKLDNAGGLRLDYFMRRSQTKG